MTADFNPNWGLQGVVLIDHDTGMGGTTPLNILPPFGRPATATADLTVDGAYAANDTIGGLITVATGRASTALRLMGIGLVVPMSSLTTAGGNLGLVVFGEEPSGTYTDSAAPTWIATDTDLVRRVPTFSFVFGAASGTVAAYATQSTAFPLDVTTDASGNLYFVILAGSTTAWTTPGSARFTVDYLY